MNRAVKTGLVTIISALGHRRTRRRMPRGLQLPGQRIRSREPIIPATLAEAARQHSKRPAGRVALATVSGELHAHQPAGPQTVRAGRRPCPGRPMKRSGRPQPDHSAGRPCLPAGTAQGRPRQSRPPRSSPPPPIPHCSLVLPERKKRLELHISTHPPPAFESGTICRPATLPACCPPLQGSGAAAISRQRQLRGPRPTVTPREPAELAVHAYWSGV
jgi:hypothetical protein